MPRIVWFRFTMGGMGAVAVAVGITPADTSVAAEGSCASGAAGASSVSQLGRN
jgi:hypothetical protein